MDCGTGGRAANAALHCFVAVGLPVRRTRRVIVRLIPTLVSPMPSFTTSRLVSHSAAKMFDLVADVEQYPTFLPLCQKLVIRRRSTLPSGEEVLVADMQVGFKAVRESFTSRVTLDRGRQVIMAEYIDGPFRSLENRWTFADRPPGDGSTGSTVSFFITYEFRNRMLSLLMGSMFDGAFRRFAEAFEHRADQVYG